MKIRILRSATRTVADGIRFYERQEAGLGAYFFNSIMSDLRSLAIHAGVHQKAFDLYYRMVCSKFPYSIYRKEDSSVDVYAVLDDRRDPKRTEEWFRLLDSEVYKDPRTEFYLLDARPSMQHLEIRNAGPDICSLATHGSLPYAKRLAVTSRI